MRYSLLLIVLFGAFASHQAQYLQLRPERREYRVHGFNSHFGGQPITSFELKDVHLYKVKKVKKIFVFSKDSILLQVTELDSSGEIIREGNYDGEYFQVRSSVGKNPSISSVTYYLNNRLIRTDTTIQEGGEFNKDDTLMLYNRLERYEYKTGELLNQQNSYYNEQYYWKPIRVNRKGTHITYRNRFRMKPRYIVFLKKKFPTNFDSLKVYPSSIGIYATFYAQKGNLPIDTAAYRTHSFFKSHPPIQKTTFLIRGQSFREPHLYFNSDRGYECGNHDYSDYPTFEGHDWTYNEMGLQDTYFSRYYPQDTSLAAIAAYKIEKEQAIKNGATFIRNADSYLPRKKTPIITRIYFVRYEYFN